MKINVLTIGPDYRTLKGGIASVLEVYSNHDKQFKFLPTHSSESTIKNILLFPLKYFQILFFLLTHPSYKIVHIHGSSYISFYRKYLFFLTLKYILRRKIIYHIHGSEYQIFIENSNKIVGMLIRHMMEKSDAIICLSIQWKQFFEENLTLKSIYILNNIIPLPVETIRNITKNIIKNEKDEKISFLLLGRVGKRKGIFDLIDTVQKNRDYFLGKIEIVIGGDGEIERLNREITEYGLEEIVRYVGWVCGEEKDRLLANSDVYLLPSYNEGLPISILEAMSYKKPIISTDVGGISTIVKNSFNGFLIEAGDKKALFTAMKYFIENREKIDEYGHNSFQISKDFLPEKVIKDLHIIYKKVKTI